MFVGELGHGEISGMDYKWFVSLWVIKVSLETRCSPNRTRTQISFLITHMVSSRLFYAARFCTTKTYLDVLTHHIEA